MKFTHFLKDLTSKDVLIAGGKGASLGEMIHAGIPVPGGFVVSSDTFDYFLDKTGLNVQIEAILNTVNHKTISSVEEASESIQSLILSFPMPEEIEYEIYNSFDSEKLSFVAVRSSATAEDGANHAWAGQLDSYLNTTRDNLIEKVRSCWASLFTPRAIFYRFEKELHEDHISVAVVVQKMVQSETSGIAFSVHPVTQDRNQMIIEAGYGLGEAIVSGAVTPDNYVVRKNDMKIESININHQQKALYRSENGGNERVNLGEKGKNQILTKEQISELAQIIMTIENHYTFPCDIEWAFEGGEFFVVQSRPITTLISSSENKIAYEKAYTRDTTMIIQQGWNECVTKPLYANGTNPYLPTVVHYMNDGVIEIWENELATSRIMNAMQELIANEPHKLHSLIDQYEKDLIEIKKYWEAGAITDVHEFMRYVDRVFVVMKGFDCMYFASVDERTPTDIRERALALRDVDTYFDSNDKLMRASLVSLYPDLVGYETTILKSEIHNPPSLEILKQRKKSFVVIGEEYAQQQTLREYISQHPEVHFHIETPPDSSTLIGQCGSGGFVKGKVRIMKRKEQIGEAKEGDIIVSTMTTPDFIPAMQKAAAIITDEGGITCHAAIVARELKKPCVIGTKFATQLLKDGDFVEVDADNGVVRILEKKTDNICRGGKQWIPAITRNMSFFHEYLTLLGHYHNSKDFGIDVAQQQLAYTKEGSKTTAFINIDEMKKYSSAVLDAVSTPDKVQLLVNAYEHHATTLLESLEALTNNITVKNWSNFCDNYQRFCAGLNITVVIGRGGGDKLALMLKEKGFGSNEVADIVGKITYPQSSTPLFSSQLDLLQVGVKVQKEGLGDQEVEKLLTGWLATYSHIPVNYCEEPWSMDDAKIQLQSLMQENCAEKYKEYIQSHQQKISDAQKLLDEIKDENITNLAYAIAQGTYLNEYRKNKFSLVSLLYRPLFSHIAKKCGSDNWRDVFYMTPSEISDVIGGILFDISACIKNRQNICYTVSDDGQIIFADDDFVVSTKAYLDSLHGTSNTKNTNQDNNSIELKGYSANKGKITAIAKVILNSKDFGKINRGEILVTTMTSVDFVPIMEKAGAFVTNEGGITSHASIVAREMNKPCIIGTQNATAIIKDGDLVEVDADNGIVRILQEAPLIVPRPLDEFYRFELSMWTATNYFHMGVAPTLKINDERLCGTCFLQYNYDKPSIAIIEKTHLLVPGKKYLSKLENTDSDFANIVYTNYMKIIALADKLQNFHIKQVKDNAIIDINEYFDEYKSLFPWVIGVGYCIDMALEEYAKEHNIDLHHIGHVGESFITKERRELAVIAAIQDTQEMKEKLKEHTYKWSFLLNNYTGYHPVSEEYFINRFDEVKNNQFGEIVPVTKPTSILEWIAFCTYIRDERKRCNMLFNGLYIEYLRRECIQYNLNFSDAVLMTPIEFEQCKNTGIPCYNGTRNLFASHNGFQDITLTDWNNIISTEIGDDKSVTGICASKGKITGIARVILETKDFDKLQSGEIIIASMTRPDFAPILPRAGGIITNEGGVTCHAAIVSRELGVPCLISTGNGTKVIKDGDMIELDATNGVARIIS